MDHSRNEAMKDGEIRILEPQIGHHGPISSFPMHHVENSRFNEGGDGFQHNHPREETKGMNYIRGGRVNLNNL